MKKTPPSDIYSRECFDAGSEDPVLKRLRWLRHKKARDYLCLKTGEIILDIGCGRGEIVEQCVMAGATAIGMDYSQDAVEISRETVKEGIIVRASATHLPFKGEVFDKVTLLDVLEHLDSEDGMKCIRDVRRVLRPGGTFIVHTPNRYERLFYLPRYFYSLFIAKQKISSKAKQYVEFGHVNVQSPISLKRMLKKEGFRSKILFSVPNTTDIAYWKHIVYKTLFFACSLWAIGYKKEIYQSSRKQ